MRSILDVCVSDDARTGVQAVQMEHERVGLTSDMQQHLAAIVDAADDAIVGAALDGTITSWNAGAERLYGYTAAEMVGQKVTASVPAERMTGLEERLALVVHGESLLNYETRHLRKDGTPVDVALSMFPIRDPSGAVIGAAAISRDVTQRRRAEAELVHRALHDSLTGLPNRALLDDRLDHALARCARHGSDLAVLFADLDDFKWVNDSHGHPAGDEVLRIVASRIRDAVRPADTVARFGGDEFVVVCEDSGRWEASLLARRIAERLEVPVEVDGAQVVLTASVGIAVGGADLSRDTLLANADAAMYQAKDRGRGRAQLFDADVHARIERRLSVESALRQALERDEFRVVYQPVISLSDSRMVGAEALLRWDSPDTEWSMPDAFIPVAESTGLIEPIGAWVLQDVGRQLREWDATGGALAECSVAVNLSALQLTPALFDALVGIVRTGVDPRRMSLELTESVLMDDAERSVESLLGLKAVGLSLAIDDFGTGYSSLAYLQRLPVDALKIDRTFIDGLAQRNGPDAAIVAAVVAMARSLGLSVIAEGVETREQLAAVERLGCDYGQGFYWSQPVPAEELASSLVGSPAR